MQSKTLLNYCRRHIFTVDHLGKRNACNQCESAINIGTVTPSRRIRTRQYHTPVLPPIVVLFVFRAYVSIQGGVQISSWNVSVR